MTDAIPTVDEVRAEAARLAGDDPDPEAGDLTEHDLHESAEARDRVRRRWAHRDIQTAVLCDFAAWNVDTLDAAKYPVVEVGEQPFREEGHVRVAGLDAQRVAAPRLVTFKESGEMVSGGLHGLTSGSAYHRAREPAGEPHRQRRPSLPEGGRRRVSRRATM